MARRLDGIDRAWFAERSPKSVQNRSPASFLHELYQPGEKVVVFSEFKSQGQAVWEHPGYPFDADALDHFTLGCPQGVWFLSNPVTGESVETGEVNKDGTTHFSRRSWRTVTSWRYLVLESDHAHWQLWLAALAQMPLPIAAIYSSGGKSIHALVRLDAASQEAWNAEADALKPSLVRFGADEKAISAVRLTRLPGCQREETEKQQALLYLNPSPTPQPIIENPIIAPGWADPLPADQDGFDYSPFP